MEILKSEPGSPRKCEYGDFELKPEEGWALHYSFIDFESKLLIVSVSIIDTSKWIKIGLGERSIPTKEYKVDLQTLLILNSEDWRKRFNYEKAETISKDKKYKLITQRRFEPENNNDSIKEELYDLQSGKLISSGESVAFRKSKRENLLESLYRSVKEKEEQQRTLDAKLTLEQFYLKQLNDLKDNDDILNYTDYTSIFKLTYRNFKFELSYGGKMPVDSQGWKALNYSVTTAYDDLDAFWKDFTRDNKWFVKCYVYKGATKKPLVLAKHIISWFNNLRKEHKFTRNDHEKINAWSALVWSEDYKITEIKQWCSCCHKEVTYRADYPKYICQDCFSKNKLNEKGNFLEFSNAGITGGFVVVCKDSNGTVLWEDDTREFCECYIDNKLFYAVEAKNGGIVIQARE